MNKCHAKAAAEAYALHAISTLCQSDCSPDLQHHTSACKHLNAQNSVRQPEGGVFAVLSVTPSDPGHTIPLIDPLLLKRWRHGQDLDRPLPNPGAVALSLLNLDIHSVPGIVDHAPQVPHRPQIVGLGIVAGIDRSATQLQGAGMICFDGHLCLPQGPGPCSVSVHTHTAEIS